MPLTKMSVRQLLGLYEAARRGKHVQSRIQKDLESLGLHTVPDFRKVHPSNLEQTVEIRRRRNEKLDAGSTGEVLKVNALEDGRWRLIYTRDKDGEVAATQPLDEHPGVQAGDRVLVDRVSTPKLRVRKVVS